MSNNKLRSWFKMKNRSLLRQIKDCCTAKSLKLSLHKVKGHSGDKWNDQADLLAKEGIKGINILKIPKTILGNLRAIPKWKDQIIECSLRSFINIIFAITYETKQASLSKTADIIVLNQKANDNKELS